ncbi:MAG: hypothetical protein DRR19_00370 [Candidatus Parabeggiatoa sp. nov. 1]|nr:MAG: hypothetical protein DRR19_00370 [Gammaproteobacteria bacterium]
MRNAEIEYLSSGIVTDNNRRIKTWWRVKPLQFGRERCHPEWIAKHYDSKNIQLLAADSDYNT